MTDTDIPSKGYWYEMYDFSERDYGSNWGFILYKDGKEIHRASGYSRIRRAGDEARKAKARFQRKENNG